MAKYSINQIAGFAKGAGFTGENLVIATAIALAESGGDADTVNSIGCVGLWQIFQRVHAPAHPSWTVAWLKHPGNNASAAYTLWQTKRWQPWQAYTNGSYKTYLSQARKAADWATGVKTKSAGAMNLGGTAGAALAKAASYVGYVESGNNNTQFWARVAPSLQGQPWCGAFVYDVLKQIGIDMKKMGYSNPFYCPQIAADAKRKGQWSTVPQVGDLALMSWNGSTIQHVEFVEKVGPKNITTIGGNTSSGGIGSQNNGGGVWRRTRARSLIKGYVRIPYDASAAGVGVTPGLGVTLDNAEQRTTTGALKENGEWNAATVVDMRLASRMPSSVTTTPAFWKHIEVWTGLPAKYQDSDLDYETVEALQWKTKQAITGRWDKNTILGIQKYLNDLRKRGMLNAGIGPGPVPD